MPIRSSDSAKTDPVIYTLTLQNELDELTRLGQWINGVAEQLSLSDKDTFRLDLTLAEAVANIIKYAYVDTKSHQITITVCHQPAQTSVDIIDDGQPFDPLKHPKVSFPRDLDEASKGGLGIHLIRTYADECFYERNENANILKMIFYSTDEDNDVPSKI